ncbi:MAG: DUF6616 family protein [Conexibacter sp.]
MHTFIELWSCTPQWTAMSPEERGAYMAAIGPAIESVVAAGVQLLACGTADRDTDHGGDWDFFAVWSTPDAETLRHFEQTVAASGWYEHFAQVNVSGASGDLDALIGAMVGASASVAG